MNEEELRQVLKMHGWTLEIRARRTSGKRYAYARRRLSGKVVSRYLGPEDKLHQFDRQTIEQKLR